MKSTSRKVWKTITRKGAYVKIVLTIENRRNFFDTYRTFLEDTVLLKRDETHQDILGDIEDKEKKFEEENSESEFEEDENADASSDDLEDNVAY